MVDNGIQVQSARDEMIRAILKTSTSPMLDRLRGRYSLSVSEPVLIGEDRIGLIFYAEGHVPLFWDCPLIDMNKRIMEIPDLIEKQPLISGHNGILTEDENEESNDTMKNIHLFAEALMHVLR